MAQGRNLNWSEMLVRKVCSPSETQASHRSLDFISAWLTHQTKGDQPLGKTIFSLNVTVREAMEGGHITERSVSRAIPAKSSAVVEIELPPLPCPLWRWRRLRRWWRSRSLKREAREEGVESVSLELPCPISSVSLSPNRKVNWVQPTFRMAAIGIFSGKQRQARGPFIGCSKKKRFDGYSFDEGRRGWASLLSVMERRW